MMAGEYQVVKSIIEYSIPRLAGWAPLMEHAIEKSILDRINFPQFQGGRGGGDAGSYDQGSGQGRVEY